MRIRVPPRPLLTFSIGLREDPAAAAEPPVKARFAIRAGERSPTTEIYRRDVHEGRANAWIEQSLDLRRYAGREIWLAFRKTLVDESGRERAEGRGSRFTGVIGEPILHDRARYPEARGVVLVSIDTLRRDHVSLYGYRRKTTPAIDAFARDAVTFEDAASTSSWTLPAHASLLTSLYPTAHGAVNLNRGLPPGLPGLPSSLRKAGFFSQAMVTHLYLSAAYGFRAEFERHRYFPETRAKELTDRALGFLRAFCDRDYFLFLHYYDPHWHYDPPPPFDRSFDPGYRGKITGVWWDFKKETRETIAQRDLEHLIALYDGEILSTDRQLDRLFREMKRLGLFERALVVLTSDHGEEFLDHGSWEHQKTLYEEQLRIPLVVKLPQGEAAGLRVREQVRLVDVAPTVLDALGLDIPPSFQGKSLLPFVRGGATEGFPRDAWSETEHTLDGSHKVALRRGKGGQKWIASFRAGSLDDVEVYALDSDPGEKQNLPLPSRDGIAQKLETFLADARRRRESGPAAPSIQLSPEALEKLKALGYVR